MSASKVKMHVPRLRMRHGAGPRHTQGGFSMIELLVAMSVTIFGLIGLMSLHKTTIQGNQAASRLVEAITIAQRTMEEIRGIPVQSKDPSKETLSTKYPDWPVVDEPLAPVTGHGGVYRRSLSLRQMALSPELVRVRIDVAWSDNGADESAAARFQHQVAMAMIRTRQEAF